MKNLIFPFMLIILTGCSIVDFSPDENVSSNPDRANQLIGKDENIYIAFSFDPDKNSAESLFKIADYQGDLDGELTWEDRKLFFNPSEEMIQGRRYTLYFSGNVNKKEGGDVRVEIILPFYYITEGSCAPFITGTSPSGGSVIGTEEIIRVVFSKSIDTGSFRKGFSISPEKEHTLLWEDEDKQVLITPDEKWENLTSYCFSFSSDICCTDSIPLDEDSEITFYVDSSHTNPEVVSTEAAMRDIAASFPPFSPDLNSIKYNDVIRIIFSEDMDRESVEAGFSITPYTAGRKIWIDRKTLIFQPESLWKWENKYTVSISSSAESEMSINLIDEYHEDFTADINELTLSSLGGKAADGFPLTSYSESSFLEIETDPVAPYTYNFIFTFSENFPSDDEKENAQNNINISCIFPPDGTSTHSGTSPFPVIYSWLSDSSLSVKYSGFTPYNSIDNIHYYYLVRLKGGTEGVINKTGNYFSDDIKQLLRTK